MRSAERLEERCLLIIPPQFTLASPPIEIPPAPELPVLRISHASSPGGDPTGLEQLLINQLDFPSNQQTAGPFPSQITLLNLFDPDGFGGSFFITAASANTQIVQGLNSANDPNLDVKIERLNNSAYIRFAPGPALFGETTVTITVRDQTFDTATEQVRIRLDDPPKLDPLSNRTVLEDAGLQTIPLTGISAGGSADDPSNGGQNRLIYAHTTKPKLTGIPTVNYDAAAMDHNGTLQFSPIRGQPVDIQNLGDNEATITVTIEDAGIDNIVGKSYDSLTGDVTITDFDATLDNQIRTQTFRFTIVPVNDPPTLDPQAVTVLPDIFINEDQASPLVIDVDASQTTITLVDASLFTDPTPFAVQVDSEQMLVTAVSGSTFTVTRGFGGTLAAAHSRGSIVFPSITLTGITAGGGSSPIGNELQNVSITPTGTGNGFFTLTFDDNVHTYTTDLIPFDAPATDSRNETVLVTANANAGTTAPSTFTLTLADNIGAVTSLDTAIDATQLSFAVDNITGFPSTAPFFISIDGEEMKVIDVAAAPVSGNPLRKTLTVEARGINGTTAAAHTDFASVIEIRTERASSTIGQLTAFLDNTSTTVTLTNPTTLPPVPFTIQIEQEVMQVTSVLGNDLTVVRGTNNTTATTHSGSGATPLRVDLASQLGQLTTTMSAGTTTLVLANPVTLPVAPFVVQVEQEQMRVTNVAGNLLTVVRGFNGTTVAAHPGSGASPISVTALTSMSQAPSTQLSAAISNAATTFNVANGNIFPDADITDPTTWFFIRIDREEMEVRDRVNNSLTVVRGVNGTLPAAHGGGAAHPVSRVDEILRVADSSIFTGTLPYDIRIDNEDMRVMSINGDELTVIRGIHGTALGAHADSSRVSSIQTTAGINFNATASEVQSALVGLPMVGSTGVQVTDGPITPSQPVTIEFIGRLGRLNLDRVTTDTAGLNGNEVQRFSYSGVGLNSAGTASGTFTLTFGGRTTAAIPFDADAAMIEAALTAVGMQPVLNPGDIIVTGGPLPASFTIEFTGQYANTNLNAAAITANTTNVQNNERQQINFVGAPTGGTFQLRFVDTFGVLGGALGQTYNTIQIAYDGTDIGTASNIESALELLGTTPMNVSVFPVSTTSWIVEFDGGSVRDRNHPTLFAPPGSGGTGNQLTPSPPVIPIFISTIEDGDQTLGFNKAAGAPTTLINGLTPVTQVFTQTNGALSIQDALIDLQSVTAADITTAGNSLPGLPVQVEFVGAFAGLDVDLMTINNSPLPVFGLSDFGAAASVTDDVNDVDNDGIGDGDNDGIGDGDGIVDILDRHFDGESQKLAVTAVSSNADIVPDPVVTYASPQGTATLTFTNNRDRFGTAIITVTVTDSGFDQKLETVGDNASITKTFQVTVRPTNDLPTIRALPDVAVPKNTVSIPISLAGISTGGNEAQDLRVTATAATNGDINNKTLLPDPSVVYTNGATTGLLTLEPIAGQTGFAIITIQVEDAGIDGSLNSTADNGVTRITFRLDVSEPPTLGTVPTTISIPEDPVTAQSLNFNVTAGGSETEPLLLTVSNTNTTLFTLPTAPIIFSPTPVNSATGTLNFAPTPQLSGTDTFHFTLTDGGRDGQLGTPGQLAADLSPTATLLTADSASIYLAPNGPGVPTNKLLNSITRTDTSITLIDGSAFPSSASPTNTFKVQIGNEVMTVVGVTTGPGLNKTFLVVRGQDATPVEPHAANDTVVLPFKIRIGNEIMRVTAVTGSNLSLVRGIDGTTPAQHFDNDAILHPFAFDNLTVTRDVSVTVTPVNDVPTLAVFTPNPLTVPEGSGQQIVSLSGITDGEAPAASQRLQVTATANNADPLATAITTTTQTTFDITNPVQFPTSGPFDIRIDNEIMTVTAVTGKTFTVTRGVGGTTAATHSSGALVISPNSDLTGPISVSYTDGATIGNLRFTPNPTRSGLAIITVTVRDGGLDNNLATVEANDTFSRVLNVNVAPIGDLPTLNAISNLTIKEDGASTLAANISSTQTSFAVADASAFPKTFPFTIRVDNEQMQVTAVTGNTLTVVRAFGGTTAATHNLGAIVLPSATLSSIALSGITDGDNNTQDLLLTATTTDSNLISALTLNYNPTNLQPTTGGTPPTTGTLTFSAGADRFGAANVTVTVTDGGNDTRLGIDRLTADTTASGATSVVIANPSRFPTATPFNIIIDSEEMLVSSITGGNTFNILASGRAQNGTTAAMHFAQAQVTAPNTAADNVSFSRTFSVTVNQLNDAPRVTAPPAMITIAESSGPQTINLTGIDAGPFETQNLSVSVTSNNTALIPTPTVSNFVAPTPGVAGSGSATINYQPAAFKSGTATLFVQIMDAGLDGNLGTLSDNATTTRAIVVQVTPVNDAPTLNAVAPVTVNEGAGQQTVSLSGITAGGGESQILRASASVVATSIAGLITNLSVDYTSPNTTGTLRFTPGADLFGTATIRVTVEDAGFDGVMTDNPGTVANEAADNATFFRDIMVTVNNVEDAPVFTVPTNATVNKNNHQNLPVFLTGVYDGDLNSQTLTFSFASSDPSFVPVPANVVVPPQGTPSTTPQTVELHFNPAANQLGSVTITVTANDGVSAPVVKNFTLNVVDANLPPVLNDPSPNSFTGITEGTMPSLQASLTGIFSAEGNIEPTQKLRITAAANNPAAFSALTVNGFVDGTISGDDTDATVDFTPSANAAGTFTITVTVRDAGPDGTFDNTDDATTTKSITVQINELGDDDPETLDDPADVVIPVSASPTQQTVNLTGIAAGQFEYAAVTVMATSNNTGLIPNPTVNYTSGSTGSLTFTPAASMTGTAEITVTVDDGGINGGFQQKFFVHVVNPPTLTQPSNPAPVAEDTTGTQSVSLTGISDGDGGTQGGVQVTAAVFSDPNGIINTGTLAVSHASPLATTGSVNYELNADRNGTAIIEVTVQDFGPNLTLGGGDDSIIKRMFSVVVTPVNDDPTLTAPALLTLTEGGPAGTINLTSIFAKAGLLLDEANQPLRVTAVSGDTSKVIVSAVNYTSPASTGSVLVTPVGDVFGTFNDLITITVEDGGQDNNLSTPGGNRTFSTTVDIDITAVNDKPTLNTINNVTVNEDSTPDPIPLSGITAGPGETQNLNVTVSSSNIALIPNDLANLSITNFNPGAGTATLNFLPLAEQSGSTTITVTVTDDGTPVESFQRTFTITVRPVNDAPTISSLTLPDMTVVPPNDSFAIDENLAAGTVIGTLDFDDDMPGSLALSITAKNGTTPVNAFSIDSNGVIRVSNAAAINFEANPVLDVTVKITDNSPVGPTVAPVMADFTINLNDAEEALVIGTSNWPSSGGLTLISTGDGKVHVRNSSNVDVVPAHFLASVSQIQVTGRSGTADVLTVDYTGGDPVPTGMTPGLTFNGQAGTGDALRFANLTSVELNTEFTGPTSADISDPNSVLGSIGATGVETIGFNTTMTSSSLNFFYGDGNDVITFADDGNTSNNLTNFSASNSPIVNFHTMSVDVTINTGNGANTVTFNGVEDSAGPAITIQGGDDNDLLRATTSVARALVLLGGSGNDTLIGGNGNDSLQGEGDDDVLTGLLGDDSFDGGGGINTLVETANVNLSLDASSLTGLGTDSVTDIQLAVLTGGTNANTISAAGFGGQVTINGGGGNDTLTGSDQDDVLTGGAGNDQIDGGGGDDTLVESGNVNLTLTDSALTGGLGSDGLSNIELARLTGGASNNTIDATGFSGSTTLLGGLGNDILKGGSGNDTVSGEGGNDTLTGGGGDNDLNGGIGTDQVVESGDFDFTVTATEITSGLGIDNLTLIEQVKLIGGSGDNTFTVDGFIGTTTLQGGNGNDTLIGGNGKDSLDGGSGNDNLTGGLGDDTFNGGTGTDMIVEVDVTSLSMTPTTMSGRGADKIVSGTMESASLTGTEGNDNISGGTFAGSLIIRGFGGQDRLTGGAGHDQIAGGDETGPVISGKIKGDTISGGNGNDTILGGAGDDCIGGGAGNDVIDGGEGNDTVSGDANNDTLIGGTGRDSLVGGTDSGNDLLFSGDFLSGDVSDGEVDTLISGLGTDTVIGESGVDVLSNSSNTASEIDAVFTFDTDMYNTIFDTLLNP